MEYIDSPWTGRIVGVEKFQGEMVNKGEVVAYLEKE
jgi:biotin carboxyl carrier protein